MLDTFCAVYCDTMMCLCVQAGWLHACMGDLKIHCYIEARSSDMQCPISQAMAHCAVKWGLYEERRAEI